MVANMRVKCTRRYIIIARTAPGKEPSEDETISRVCRKMVSATPRVSIRSLQARIKLQSTFSRFLPRCQQLFQGWESWIFMSVLQGYSKETRRSMRLLVIITRYTSRHEVYRWMALRGVGRWRKELILALVRAVTTSPSFFPYNPCQASNVRCS